MKGLELAERYYEEVGLPTLTRAFPELMPRMAFGLCGEGSECLGYDDDLSRDHDFGPSFCIWMSDEDFANYGLQVRRAYSWLPQEFLGYHGRSVTEQGGGRVGAMRISDFYRKFTGCPAGPQTNLEWLRVPEHLLAQAVSGRVFRDDAGTFTGIRAQLLAFYPEEVRWKKMAARAVTMAQAGQYNYPRSIKRGEDGAAYFALREFLMAAFSMAHLLEKRYMPYYKWAHRSFEEGNLLAEHREDIRQMMARPLDRANAQRAEDICHSIRLAWQSQGLTRLDEDFLEPQGWELYRRITDPDLRARHIMDG